MFRPNRFCEIYRKKQSYNIYGEDEYNDKEIIPFALIKLNLKTTATTVRTDSSASRGLAEEYRATSKILTPTSVNPNFGDKIIINCYTFEVSGVEPRYHVLGHQDHWELVLIKKEVL
jgi:hypothetical protein